MKTKFTQRDYFLYLKYYEKVLKFFKKEMEKLEKSGKKTLWYHGAQETLERLKKEEGKNLTPQDVDKIIYVLVDQVKEKQN